MGEEMRGQPSGSKSSAFFKTLLKISEITVTYCCASRPSPCNPMD